MHLGFCYPRRNQVAPNALLSVRRIRMASQYGVWDGDHKVGPGSVWAQRVPLGSTSARLAGRADQEG